MSQLIVPKKFVPRVYQTPMISHGLSLDRAALWGGMGVGKTVVMLSILQGLVMAGESAPTLILGPKRVARKVWTDECKKWNHLRGFSVIPLLGTPKDRLAALRMDAPVYTINYDNLVWLTEHFGEHWPFRTVVADEATRLKSLRVAVMTARNKDGSAGKTFLRRDGGKRALALADIAFAGKIRRFYQLTGTPSPNGLKDLWGQLWFLDAGRRLGNNYTAFMQRWFETGFDGYTIEPKKGAADEIHRLVGDICLSIDGADYFDLEKPIINVISVQLPRAAREKYRELWAKMKMQLEDHGRNVTAVNAAAPTQKSLQLSNGAVYVDQDADDDTDPRAKEWKPVHDEKLEALGSIIEESGGAPMLVCYQFRSDMARILKAFPQARVLQSEQDEDDFKAGKIPVLLLHPKSGGHGIDGFQHVCDTITFFAQDWNLEEHQQVIERIGPVRQAQAGFKRPITINYIIAEDTVDELVMERRESKKSVQQLLMEATKRR